MEQLDVRTVLVMLAVTLNLTAAALWILLRENRHVPGLAFFPFSCFAIGTGSLLLVSQDRLPAWLAIAVGDTLVGLAIALAFEGIRRFYGGLPRWRWIVVLTGLSWVGFVLFTSVWPSLPARVFLISTLLAGLSLAAAWIAWRRRHSEAFMPTALIFTGFGLMGLINGARLILGRSIDSLFSPNVYTVLAIGGALLCFLCFNTGVVMTMTQRFLREAHDAIEAKSHFLAVMSHEIRTPMTGVLGLTELLLSSDLDAKQRRMATLIQDSGENLSRILDDILAYSRLEAGKVSLEQVEAPLGRVLATASELIAATADSKGLAFEQQLDDDLPENIRCDPVRIGQILSNLLNNAVKFTKEGRVVLRACRAGQSWVRFEVSDTGVGIPRENRVFLFEAFSQADASITRKYGGTGLGLAISKQLVELHGGRIGVESEEGQGSTFWFEIPLSETAVEPDPSTEKAGSRHRRPARILVVEDDSTTRFVVSTMLRQLGHEVDLVTDGLAAVTAVGRSAYDLVLMDCHMPEMDGFEATQRIRSDPSHAGLKIIAATAAVLPEQRQRCRDAGMDDILNKPLTIQRLAEVLDLHLEDRS